METTTVVTTSGAGNINWSDIGKGLIVAVLSPVFTVIMQSLNAGSLTFDWKAIGVTALAAGLGYITKNFFSPAQTIVKSAN